MPENEDLLHGFRCCKVFNFEELNKLNTKHLLKIRKDMLSLEESANIHDYGNRTFWSKDTLEAMALSEDIFFKEDIRWKKQYFNLKNILGNREHIASNKFERNQKNSLKNSRGRADIPRRKTSKINK